jgi:hypothetical protein
VARSGLILDSDGIPNLVLLGISSESGLYSVVDSLQSLGIPHKSFREPDLNDSVTAVATAPLDSSLRRHFRRYKLI